MRKKNLKTITSFYILSIVALLILTISSIIMINQNGMNQRLQGWVNLLWLPLPIVTLIIDRICVRKFGTEKSNKYELYVLVVSISLFAINWIRLQLQT